MDSRAFTLYTPQGLGALVLRSLSWRAHILIYDTHTISPVISEDCICWMVPLDVSYGPTNLFLVLFCSCCNFDPLSHLSGMSFEQKDLYVCFVITSGA